MTVTKKMLNEKIRIQNSLCWELPRGPVVRHGAFSVVGLGSIPGQGTKIPKAMQPGKKKKKSEHPPGMQSAKLTPNSINK